MPAYESPSEEDPSHQHGTSAALEFAVRALKVRHIVVLGHAHFYPRFGFSPKLAAHLESPFPGGDSFMALELVPGALDGVVG